MEKDSADVNQPLEELMGKIGELNSITSSDKTSIVVQKNKEMLDSLLSKVEATEFELQRMQDKFRSYDDKISKTNQFVSNEIMKINERIDSEFGSSLKRELKEINEIIDANCDDIETIKSDITVIQTETNTKIEEKVTEIYTKNGPIQELNELKSLVQKLQEQTTFLSDEVDSMKKSSVHKEIKEIKEEVSSIKNTTVTVQKDMNTMKKSIENMGNKYDKEIGEVKESVEVIKKNGKIVSTEDDDLYARVKRQIRAFIDLVKVIIITVIALFLAVVNP